MRSYGFKLNWSYYLFVAFLFLFSFTKLKKEIFQSPNFKDSSSSNLKNCDLYMEVDVEKWPEATPEALSTLPPEVVESYFVCAPPQLKEAVSKRALKELEELSASEPNKYLADSSEISQEYAERVWDAYFLPIAHKKEFQVDGILKTDIDCSCPESLEEVFKPTVEQIKEKNDSINLKSIFEEDIFDFGFFFSFEIYLSYLASFFLFFFSFYFLTSFFAISMLVLSFIYCQFFIIFISCFGCFRFIS